MTAARLLTFYDTENLQHRSAISPIFRYMKEQGYTVGWGLSGSCVISSTVCRENIIFQPHGVSRENCQGRYGGGKGILVQNKFHLDVLKKKHPKEHHKRFKLVGWPKIDPLILHNRGYFRSFKLPYEKTILCAINDISLPLSQPREILLAKKVVDATKKLEINLIIKPHLGSGDFDIPKKLKSSHVLWINPTTWEDITKLFPIVDLLLAGSRTSVGAEFLVTNKPIVVLHPYPTFAGFKLNSEEFPGILIEKIEKLESAIEEGLNQPTDYDVKRKRVLERIIHKPDGHACERAAKAIMELVKI